VDETIDSHEDCETAFIESVKKLVVDTLKEIEEESKKCLVKEEQMNVQATYYAYVIKLLEIMAYSAPKLVAQASHKKVAEIAEHLKAVARQDDDHEAANEN